MTATKPTQGARYVLTFTQPMYLKSEQRYAPDSFRFVDPAIVHVAYGGRAGKDVRRHCAICGRMGGNYHQFLNLESMKEIYLSDHCLAHESTELWGPNTPQKVIDDWYHEENLRRSAEAGDGLAGLVMALRDLEDDDGW